MKSLLTGLLLFVCLLWVFGELSSDSTPSGEDQNTSSASDETPPGYERGLTCSYCNGTGVHDRDYLGQPGSKGGQCLSCMGKGFNWSKKDPFAVSQPSAGYPAIERANVEPITTETPLNDPEPLKTAPLNAKVELATATMQVATEQPSITPESTHFTGNVGKLSASFDLIIKKSGTAAGSYYYNKYPAKAYTLQGRINDNGNFELTEYTDGVETAKCYLTLAGSCYTGVMNNTDGRNLVMKMCN